MKSTWLFAILLSASHAAWAIGVDNSGGGMDMPMATLVCQGSTQIQFREFSIDNGSRMGAQPALWITSPGDATQRTDAAISYLPSGARVFVYGDFFCTRRLVERTPKIWQLLSSCEGKSFSTQCTRMK